MTRPLVYITSRRWWRWQTAAAVAGLMMGLSCLIAVTTNAVDERSDVANDEAGRLRDQRSDYEAECRYRINLAVTTIEGKQLDGMSDLLTALANDDEPAARRVISGLERLQDDKLEAEEDRSDAVETCNREARDLYPTGG
jgi:hypothetical protein